MAAAHLAHLSRTRNVLILFFAIGIAGCAPVRRAAAPTPSAKSVFLFSYFVDNGQDGLHLATSDDGLKFTALGGGRSYLTPTLGGKLMRDPSVVLGPDGVFHMVWTTGWWDHGIGLAHSKDLVTWSEQTWLPVMEHEPKVLNCWAPEIFYDAATNEYLIFWASTVRGRFPDTEPLGDKSTVFGGNLDHRIYVTTTRDFTAFSKARLFYDGGFNSIDAVIARDGADYLLFVKDETKFPEPKKNLRLAKGPTAQGPFGPASGPFTESWVEGPSVARVGSRWFVYYDEYTRHRYGALASSDLVSWEPVAGVEFPVGARHGTVFPAPRSVVDRLNSSNAR
jgi:beta-xylosidase